MVSPKRRIVTVTRAQFEARLAWVAAQTGEPRAGAFGPGSVSWQIDREWIVLLAGGRAALLQLAHPFVAHAVEEHSRTQVDPLGRFQRTFDNVHAMVFGDLEHALRSARRVRSIHERITGTLGEPCGAWPRGARYEANDAGALLWVYATLVESAALAHELFLRPLSAAELERYYRESWRFAALFGIPQDMIPGTWAEFTAYCERMWRSDQLVVSRPALRIRRFLFARPRGVRRRLFRWLEIMTAGLMPTELRAPFELRFGPRERRIYGASRAALRGLYPRLPARARAHPVHEEGLRRAAGRPRRDRLGRLVEKVLLRAIDKGA